MKTFLLSVLMAFLFFTNYGQISPDSLLGVYKGSRYKKFSDESVWHYVMEGTQTVTEVDTINCTLSMLGGMSADSGDFYSFWTEYSYCNGTYNPPEFDITYQSYPKFYSKDSIREFYVVPRPFPYTNRVHYLFLGKRMPSGYVSTTANESELVSLYPNPFNEALTLFTDKIQNCYVSIYNAMGVLVYATTINQSITELNLAFLKKGVYMVCIKSENGQINFVKRIVKG